MALFDSIALKFISDYEYILKSNIVLKREYSSCDPTQKEKSYALTKNKAKEKNNNKQRNVKLIKQAICRRVPIKIPINPAML